MKPMNTSLDMLNTNTVANLPNPVNAGDAASKGYVDSAVEGLAWKDSVRVAAPGNVNLASPGANVDAIAMVAGDRFLAPNQTTASENGIYIWNGAAVPATRALDMNSAAEVEQAVTTVEEGTSAGATFRQTQVNVTLGTTNLVWTSFGTSAPAASTGTPGIAALATQAEVDAGAVTNKIVTPATLAAYSGRLRKVTQTIGDGSATAYNINHNLNTRDVQVEVYKVGGNYDSIICDVTRPSVNQITVTITPAPASNSMQVVVIG